MDCKEFSNLLDAWLDGTLPDRDADRMREHAEQCDACASLYALRQDCRRLDEEIEVPEAFSSSWRQMIREEEEMEGKAISKSVRISPFKVRLVIDLIRGKKADEAERILENLNKISANIVLKVLKYYN